MTETHLVIHCPNCGKQHVDEGKWAKKPHKKHLCFGCGQFFQITEYATVGIAGEEQYK